MNIRLKYGEGTITVDIPNGTRVVTVDPPRLPRGARPAEALKRSLDQPIGSKTLGEVLDPDGDVGRLLVDRDRAARIQFEVAARNTYFDLKPFLDRYRRIPNRRLLS